MASTEDFFDSLESLIAARPDASPWATSADGSRVFAPGSRAARIPHGDPDRGWGWLGERASRQVDRRAGWPANFDAPASVPMRSGPVFSVRVLCRERSRSSSTRPTQEPAARSSASASEEQASRSKRRPHSRKGLREAGRRGRSAVGTQVPNCRCRRRAWCPPLGTTFRIDSRSPTEMRRTFAVGTRSWPLGFSSSCAPR